MKIRLSSAQIRNVLIILFFPTILYQYPCFAQNTQELKTREFNLTLATDDPGLLIERKIDFDKEFPFTTMPDFKGSEIIYGHMKTGDEKFDIPFAWDVSNAALYIDANRNADLTDDTDAVFRTEEGMWQEFEDIKLNLHYLSTTLPLSANISLSKFDEYTYGSASFVYGFKQNITLDNKKYKLLVTDNLDGQLNEQDLFAILPEDPNNMLLPQMCSVYLPERLFIEGKCYQCVFEYRVDDSDKLAVDASFTEVPIICSQVRINARFIERLVLVGGDITSILFKPRDTVSVPVGKYECIDICLAASDRQLIASDNPGMLELTIGDTEVFDFKAGDPLKPSVEILKRAGRNLTLSYELKGSAGESYPSNFDYEKPPLFEAYKGEKLIASGEFEYG